MSLIEYVDKKIEFDMLIAIVNFVKHALNYSILAKTMFLISYRISRMKKRKP